MKPYPPAHGPASTNARLDAPARRQFQGAAPHEPLFVERSPTETGNRGTESAATHRQRRPRREDSLPAPLLSARSRPPAGAGSRFRPR
jgi:hypothetical protein